MSGERERTEGGGALPRELEALVQSVARSVRLRRAEREDVARELRAHFRDGLGAGESAGELARAFGDARTAAKLIRRAKLRQRGPLSRLVRGVNRAFLWSLGVALVLHIGLTAWHFTGTVNVSRDYVAELNREVERAAESDRAWGLYVEAMHLYEGTDERLRTFPWVRAGDEEYGEALAYLDRNRGALAVVREAAGRRILGAPLSHGPNPELPERMRVGMGEGGAQQGDLLSALLPHLGELRRFARLLTFEAKVAAGDGDGELAAANIEAMVGMSRQLLTDHGGFLITQLVGVAVFELSLDTLGRMLRDHPGALDERQLGRLAHVIGAVDDGLLVVSLDGERRIFEDVVQRVYTDDGRGGGRPAPMSRWSLDRSILGEEWAPAGFGDGALVDVLMGSVAVALAPSRGELVERYERYVCFAESFLRTPLWEITAEQEAAAGELRRGGERGPLTVWEMPLLSVLSVNVEAMKATVERSLQRRDAAAAAVALELHRRRHGGYPGSLEELVPGLLPALPRDRFDGAPLRYVVRDGAPVLYSVGVNGVDNGGKPASDAGRWVPRAALERMMERGRERARVDGDWVLFPVE